MVGKKALALSCVQCNAPLTLKAVGQTVVIACASCGSINDVSNPDAQFILQAQSKLKIQPFIPLGQRGKLHGDDYEAIGFMRRCDKTGLYEWSEYLLFNPYKGFRWLTEYQGHWNYVLMTKQKPQLSPSHGQRASYLGKHYQLFLKGTAKVIYVLGEFYWQVKVGDRVEIEDYMNPPEILSREIDQQEEIWSIGEYIEPDEIQKVFDLKKPMPLRMGIAPNQPSPHKMEAVSLKWVILFLMAILTLTQIVLVNFAKADKVFEENYTFQKSVENMNAHFPSTAAPAFSRDEKIQVSPPFELKGGTSNVAIRAFSDLKNNWMSLNIKMINDQTGKIYSMSKEISFYSGYDSEGYWSEGGKSDETFLSSVPDGTYHLVIQPEGSSTLLNQSFIVSVIRDAPNWSNYWFFCFLILVFPLYVWLRQKHFEYRRWLESDVPE